MKKTIKNITIILISTCLVLFFIELSLRLVGLGNPIIYEKNLLFGYQPKSNQKVKRFNNSMITINNENFRINNLDSKGEKKIYFFGDSVTYGGSYIDDKNIFSSKTCALLNKETIKYSCLNAGVNAYGLENILSRYNYIFNKDKNSNYIILLIPGSFKRNFIQINSLPYFTNNISNNYFRASLELIMYALDRFRNNIRFKKLDRKGNSLSLELKEKILSDLILLKDAQIKNKKLRILISLSNPKNQDNYSENLENFILLKSKKINLDLINIQSKINDHKNIFHDVIHLNENGHHQYAEILSNLINTYEK